MANLLQALTEIAQSPLMKKAAGIGVKAGSPSHLAAKQEAGALLNKILSQTNIPSQSSGAMFMADVLGDAKAKIGLPSLNPNQYDMPFSGAFVKPSDAANFFYDSVPTVVQKGKTLPIGSSIPATNEYVSAIEQSMPYVGAEVPEFMSFAKGIRGGKNYDTASLYEILKNEMYAPYTGSNIRDELSKAGFGSLMFKSGFGNLPSDAMYLMNASQAKKIPMVMRDPKMTFDMIQQLYPKLIADPISDAMRQM